MAVVDIVVPELGESVTEGTVTRWLVQPGERVEEDAPVVELDTEKVSVEVPAPASGVLAEIQAEAGQDVAVGAVLGRIDSEAQPTAEKPAAAPSEVNGAGKPEEKAAETPPPSAPPAEARAEARPGAAEPPAAPSARRLLQEHGLTAAEVQGTGDRGRIRKEDVERHVREARGDGGAAARRNGEDRAAEATRERETRGPAPAAGDGRTTQRVPMTRLRRSIARRLKEAQDTAAMLTTFNEVDLTGVMDLRRRYRDAFEERHGVRLGIMSFFVKAAVEALKAHPVVNAYIDGDEIVYHDYYDVGVAVSTDRGLVVPVLRDAERMSFAEVEKRIGQLAKAANDGKLTLDQLSGGTFSITNGGVFGSMLSTPILNPPQSGILGMHAINERPMAVNGKVEVRPMMYLALSYDHRLVDGSDAVRFLVKIKQVIEDPSRLFLEL